MAPPPIHMDGGKVDRVQWAVEPAEDAFDAAALEEAMLEARDAAYQELARLDAA